MQVLKELAQIIDQEKLQYHTLARAARSKSKLWHFFRALLSDQFPSEDEAADYYYQTGRQGSGFQKLKAKLWQALIAQLFVLDLKQDNLTDRQLAYFTAYREWAAVKILQVKNARQAPLKLSERVLRIAQKFEFTDLTVDVARYLRIHYGVQEGDLKKYELYNQLYAEEIEKLRFEDLAEELYTDLIIRYVSRKSLEKTLHQKALNYYRQVAPAMERYASFRLQLSGNLLRVIVSSSLSDHQSTIRACREAIAIFEKKEYQAGLPLYIFSQQLMVCHTQLGNYEQAEMAAERCLRYLDAGSFNWFKCQEQRFVLALHTGCYEHAQTVFNQTVAQQQFAQLPQNLREMWLIYEGYLHFLHECRLFEQTEEEAVSFRLTKFLNSTPIFSQDKRGMNISILILQILLLIHQQKFGLVIDKIEAIEKYCSRYLNEESTRRSYYFIKMLLQIPKVQFHREAVERKVRYFRQRLSQYPIDLSKQSHEIEIVPYETLWDLLLASLDNSFHRPRNRQRSSTRRSKNMN